MVGMASLQLSTALADGNDWMSTVDGNTYVSRMSIPGAHDAGTGHGFTGTLSTYGARFAATQSLTITQQWNAGVRAFDLRPALLSGSNNSNADNYSDMYIWHGIIRTTQTLQTALQTLCDLLDAAPTETAIVLMRHETDAYSSVVSNSVSDANNNFQAKLTSLLTKDNKIKNYLLTNFHADIKLNEARGKIILLMRDYNVPVGGKVTGWDNRKAPFLGGGNGLISNITSQSFNLFIQDLFNTEEQANATQKTEDIQRLLQYTTQEHMNDGVWVINEASGYNEQTSIVGNSFPASSGYAGNAVAHNPEFINYLSSANQGGTGIVLMDYAGVNSVSISNSTYNVRGLDLVNAIINQNSKPSYTSTEYEEYHRALNNIPDGAERLISTTVGGTKYYLTTYGRLTSNLAYAGKFTFAHTLACDGNWISPTPAEKAMTHLPRTTTS